MPWLREAKKDAASCEMPRVAAKQASIRGCPNGETQRDENPVIPAQAVEANVPK